jgi:TonB-linked SusC/RagA family outer membrane protein
MQLLTANCRQGKEPIACKLDRSASCRGELIPASYSGKSKRQKLFRVMKLIAIFLFVISMTASATGKGQTVTLDLKNVTIQRVLKEVIRQTGVSIIYNDEIFVGLSPVTINVKDASVKEVLDKCLKKEGFEYSVEGSVIVLRKKEASETKLAGITTSDEIPPLLDIKGRVTNEKGEPVEGVSVSVKGTNRGTVTNANGEFSLSGINGNETLVFTSTNMEPLEMKVAGKTYLTVSLKTMVSSLSEVTISASTGYQTISKERAPGSFDVIGQDILSKRPVSNLSSALQGLVAGMQGKENIDGSIQFLIRGNSSLYADQNPLVVVDGFPISSSDFSDINPNDVESVTVLKDASAASIWGARSANGVIVITTKHSKIAANKVNIEMNAFTSISNYIDLDHVLAQASSGDQVKYERLAWDKNWLFNPYANSFTEIGKPLTLAQELLFAKKNGLITEDQMNNGLDSLSNINNRQQIKDLLLRRGILNQFNLNISSATDRNKSYSSLMYEKRDEGFRGSGYDRFVVNFNDQFKVTDFLEFNFGTNIQYKKQETSGATVGEIQQLSPYETLLDPDGNYSVNLNTWNRQQLSLLPLNKFPYSDWSYNLLREVRNRELTSEDLSARLQGGINIKIMKGLTMDSKIQYEKRKTDYDNYYNEETFLVRNTVNVMTNYNSATQAVGTAYLPKGGILKSNNSNLESYDIRNQLNFNRTFASKHNIVAIAGMEITQYLNTSKTDPWVYGYFPDKLQSTVPVYGYGSSVDQFKDFRGNTTTLSGGNTSFGWNLDRYVSYYANASYNYNSKYTLSGSIRNDASNFITDDPHLRRSPFWSLGGMWNMKRESFLQGADFLNRLNMRITYGKNGNVEKSTSTKTLVSVSNTVSATTGTITATVSSYGNPFLRWERTTTTNLGFDFGFFNNRLTGKIDFYNKLGQDIVGTVSLPAADGTTSQKFNNAKITNKGIEIELDYNTTIGKYLNYTSALTYSYNRNRITNLFYPSQYVYEVLGSSFVQGRPVGSVYSFTYLGMIDSVPNVAGPGGIKQPFNDAALYNRGLGLPFLNYEGTSIPPHTLGWLNSFNYKGLNLMVLFVGKFGGVYRDPTFNFATTIGSSKTFVDQYVKDVFAGDPNIPQFPRSNETQFYLWDRYTPYLSGLVESSSYIECKQISLQYDLPQKIAKAIQMKNLKVFAQVSDIGLIWAANKKGYNPDWLPGSNKPVTSYLLGINFKF